VKKTTSFQWKTTGETIIVEVSLIEDSRGFHWNSGLTVGGSCVLDYLTRDDMKDILPDLQISMTMLRDEILEELRRSFDREMMTQKNELT
jgi:hypothetical protein